MTADFFRYFLYNVKIEEIGFFCSMLNTKIVFFKLAFSPSFFNITEWKKWWIVSYYLYNKVMKTDFEYRF